MVIYTHRVHYNGCGVTRDPSKGVCGNIKNLYKIMKKIIVIAIVTVFSITASAQSALKLVAGTNYKIANISTDTKGYIKAVAECYIGGSQICFNVEKSTAVEINKLSVPKGMRIVLFVYFQYGMYTLGSYQLESIPVPAGDVAKH